MSTENHPRAQPGTDQDTRRKIIKGIAGLPAVLTLASGSASAVTSIQECALEPGQNPVDDAPVPLNTDLDNPPDSVVDASCLEYDPGVIDNGLVKPPSGAPQLGNQFYDRGNTTPVRQQFIDGDGKEQACVVFVKDDPLNPGTLSTSIDGAAHGGVPVTASCYASFTVGAP